MTHPRIGVCGWSLGARGPQELVGRLRAAGIGSVQLALMPVLDDPAAWGEAAETLAAAGIRIASGMLAMAGEDYSTLESIRRTGGVRPDATWPENLRRAAATAQVAAEAAIGLVTFHAGFFEEGRGDPGRGAMIDRLREIADLFGDRGVGIALETGQETAATLLGVLAELDRPQVGVNFDPANMILYGMGDPVASLKQLAGLVRQVHVKDARPASVPGTWGREVPAGRGAVRWDAFFEVVLGLEPPVDLVIEREAGPDRLADIATACRLIEQHMGAALDAP